MGAHLVEVCTFCWTRVGSSPWLLLKPAQPCSPTMNVVSRWGALRTCLPLPSVLPTSFSSQPQKHPVLLFSGPTSGPDRSYEAVTSISSIS